MIGRHDVGFVERAKLSSKKGNAEQFLLQMVSRFQGDLDVLKVNIMKLMKQLEEFKAARSDSDVSRSRSPHLGKKTYDGRRVSGKESPELGRSRASKNPGSKLSASRGQSFASRMTDSATVEPPLNLHPDIEPMIEVEKHIFGKTTNGSDMIFIDSPKINVDEKDYIFRICGAIFLHAKIDFIIIDVFRNEDLTRKNSSFVPIQRSYDGVFYTLDYESSSTIPFFLIIKLCSYDGGKVLIHGCSFVKIKMDEGYLEGNYSISVFEPSILSFSPDSLLIKFYSGKFSKLEGCHLFIQNFSRKTFASKRKENLDQDLETVLSDFCLLITHANSENKALQSILENIKKQKVAPMEPVEVHPSVISNSRHLLYQTMILPLSSKIAKSHYFSFNSLSSSSESKNLYIVHYVVVNPTPDGYEIVEKVLKYERIAVFNILRYFFKPSFYFISPSLSRNAFIAAEVFKLGTEFENGNSFYVTESINCVGCCLIPLFPQDGSVLNGYFEFPIFQIKLTKPFLEGLVRSGVWGIYSKPHPEFKKAVLKTLTAITSFYMEDINENHLFCFSGTIDPNTLFVSNYIKPDNTEKKESHDSILEVFIADSKAVIEQTVLPYLIGEDFEIN